MGTLLQDVKKIEEEVKERIVMAETEGRKQLNDLIQAEPKVIEGIKEAAEKEGQGIEKEKIAAAKAEMNATKQDRERVVKAVHEKAEENRNEAVNLAIRFFNKEFISAS